MIVYLRIYGLIILSYCSLIFVGCEKLKPLPPEKPIELSVIESPKPQIQPSLKISPIQKFDFENFTYPEPEYGYLSRKKGIGYFGSSRGHYRLTDGEEPVIRGKDGMLKNSPASLVSVEYADLTGDDEPEALIRLSIQTGGSAIADNFYFYRWQNKTPQLIFSFSAGDRADGGFRTMNAINGDLVIELNA